MGVRYLSLRIMFGLAIGFQLRCFADSDIEAWKTLRSEALKTAGNGSPAEAEALLQRALSGLAFPESEEAVVLWNDLGGLDQSQLRLVNAERNYKRAIEINRKLSHPDEKVTAIVLMNLGIIANERNQFALGETRLREASVILEKNHGLETQFGRLLLSSLALSIQKQGRYEEATRLYDQALTETRLHAGEHVREFAGLLSNLALLRFETGDYARALTENETVLGIRRELKNNDDTIVSLNNLGQCLVMLGRSSEAEALLGEAIALERKSRAGPYPHLADTLINLAVLEKNDGRLTAARQHGVEALKIIEQYGGNGHPDLAIVWNNLGLIAMAEKNFKEAKSMFDNAADLWGRTVGTEDPKYAALLSNLGALASLQGHHKKAQALFERAIQIEERRLGNGHSQTASDVANLASEYFFQKKYDRAVDLFQKAESAEEKTFGPDSLKTAQVLADLAIVYRAAKQFDDAIATYRKAIRALELSAGPDSPRLSAILRSYAGTLRAKQQFGEAEQAEVRALGIQVRNAVKSAHSEVGTSTSSSGLSFQ